MPMSSDPELTSVTTPIADSPASRSAALMIAVPVWFTVTSTYPVSKELPGLRTTKVETAYVSWLTTKLARPRISRALVSHRHRPLMRHSSARMAAMTSSWAITGMAVDTGP